MADEINTTETTVPAVVDSSLPAEINIADLNTESKALLNKIIAEADPDKTKDLTYLFNQNQNKKTMVRVDKLSELMDAITDQAMTRFTQRPDEISNQELLQSLKTVADLIEKGQKQVVAPEQPAPLIQINQQNNELNVGDGKIMGRDSRERVKNAVLALLQQVQKPAPVELHDDEEEEIITVDEVLTTSEDSNDDK